MTEQGQVDVLHPCCELDSRQLSGGDHTHHAWLYNLSEIQRAEGTMCSITDVLPRPFSVTRPLSFMWGLHYLTAQGRCVLPRMTVSYAEGSQGNVVISEPVKLAHVDPVALAAVHQTDSKVTPGVGETIDMPCGLFESSGGTSIKLAPQLAARSSSSKSSKKHGSKKTGGIKGLYQLPTDYSIENVLVLAALVAEVDRAGDGVQMLLAKPINDSGSYELAVWHTEPNTGAMFYSHHATAGKKLGPQPKEAWIIVDDSIGGRWMCSGVYMGTTVEDTLKKTFRSWRIDSQDTEVPFEVMAAATETHLASTDEGRELQLSQVVCNRNLVYGSAVWDPEQPMDTCRVTRFSTTAEHHRVRDTNIQSPHCFHDGYLCLLVTPLHGKSGTQGKIMSPPALEIGYRTV